jgi:IS605 OrfB family transposase
MQVAKSVTLKVSPKINMNKFLQLRQFYNQYQSIARFYSSYILEHNLHKSLVNDLTARDLKQILHQQLYRQIKETFDVGSQTIQEIRDVVVEAFNSWAKLYKQWFDGETEQPPSVPKVDEFTVRMNMPRVCSIFKHGKEFPFFFKVKVNGSDKRITIPVECGEYQHRLLEDALNDKYKLGTVQLVRRKGWFYFVVCIKKSVDIVKSDTVVGVDVGLKYQAVITVLHEDGYISDVEFVKYSKLLDKIRYLWKRIDYLKSILPKEQRTSRQIRRLWRKIHRINNWIAHNISKRIVERAKQHNAMIAIENLSNFKPVKGEKSKKLNRQLSNWIHGKIKDFVLYKARWEGIYVKVVPPRYTSKRCHICGSEGFRHGVIFKCSHGYTSNADFNASVNIALRAKFPKSWGIVNMPSPSRCKAPSVREW